MTTPDVLQLCGLLFTAGGVLWGVWSYRGQMHAQLFLHFTQRYDEILQSFPDSGREFRLSVDGDLPAESADLRLAVLRYLNLCSEEFYMKEQKLLPPKVWEYWQAELERTLRSPLVQREWPYLKSEFASYGEFRLYLEGLRRN